MSMIGDLYIVPANVAQRLMTDPATIHAVLEPLYGSDAALSLEKSWHGLHFVLTGTAWEGEPPLNIVAVGGEPIGDEDLGYGPARLLDPAGVAALHAALTNFSNAEFDTKFDLQRLEAAEIYPTIWDEPLDELRQEYRYYFEQMKALVRRAAESGQALIVTIT